MIQSQSLGQLDRGGVVQRLELVLLPAQLELVLLPARFRRQLADRRLK